MSKDPQKLTKGDYYILGVYLYLLIAVYWFFNAESWGQYIEGMAGWAMIAIAVMVWDGWQERKGG